MQKNSPRQKIVQEMDEYVAVFLCLAPFFMSAVTFRIYLTGESGNHLFAYGAALLKALILAKVILLGELVHLGRRSESKPLIVSTIHKSIVFTIFYLAFHLLEETAHGVLRGQSCISALLAALMERGQLFGLGLLMFFAFIPFFAIREIRRVIGVEEFDRLFFGRESSMHSHDLSGAHNQHKRTS